MIKKVTQRNYSNDTRHRLLQPKFSRTVRIPSPPTEQQEEEEIWEEREAPQQFGQWGSSQAVGSHLVGHPSLFEVHDSTDVRGIGGHAAWSASHSGDHATSPRPPGVVGPEHECDESPFDGDARGCCFESVERLL